MQRSTDVELTQDEAQVDSRAWASRTGTFDPVEDGVALVALDCSEVSESGQGVPAGVNEETDSVAEYMARESAYVEPHEPA